MTSEEATQLIGSRVGVQHGEKYLEGVLVRVGQPRHWRGRTELRTRVDVRLRRVDGHEDTAIFDVSDLVDLRCVGDEHVWPDDAEDGDTCNCGAWYRFPDRIQRTPEPTP